MKNISDFFGCMVFDDRVMKANLSAEVYNSLRKTIDKGAKLDIGKCGCSSNEGLGSCKWRHALYSLVSAAYWRNSGET